MIAQKGNMTTFLRYANLIFAFGQIFASYIAYWVDFGMSLSEISRIFPFPLLPPGWAFSIWGPLFILIILFGVAQFLPTNQHDPLLYKLRYKTAFAFAVTTLWVAITQLMDVGNADFLFALAVLGFSLSSVMTLSRYYKYLNNLQYYCYYLPISAFAGWITIASLITLSMALKYSIFDNFGLSDTAISIILLVCAMAFVAYIFALSNHNIIYLLPVIWGLYSISVDKYINKNYAIACTSAICQAVCIGMALYARHKIKNKNIFKK